MIPMTPDALEPRRHLAADFAPLIDNPYLPLIPGSKYVYRGAEGKDRIKVVTQVTRQTKEILGITTTVVRDREYENGKLIEDTLDWFAQDKAGNVWYFGEDSKEIENGKVVSTEGSWEAGVNGPKPGIIMKAHPRPGDTYRQEAARGVAEDRARVLSLKEKVKLKLGAFGEVLQTEETTPLEPSVSEHKFYAYGVGFVEARGITGGSERLRLVSFKLPPEAFVQTIDNPYLPMVPGIEYVYAGSDGKDKIRNIVTVTNQTKEITGVTTTVVRDREFENGDLVEDTRDWFAQDVLGNVWYFGEASQDIEDGKVVSIDGSWEAGVNGAKAGIVMKARPAVGDAYQQEDAPKVAEDRGEVIHLDKRVNTPFARFGSCIQTAETDLLEPGALEHKFYAPGIGFVKAQEVRGGNEVLSLVDIRLA